jgi:aminocarboxymuconate-semialdehyde decarboxylase
MIIDVHAHYFPPAYTELYDRLSGRKSFPQHPVELDSRIADLDAAGVDVQVIGLGHNQPQFEDREASIECATFANDTYAEAIAQYGGRLAAFGAIPLPHVDAALSETARCLDELGFAGYRMGPKFGGPNEATIAAARLVLSGVSTRYPGIHFIVAPMGGTLPWLWRRFEWMSQDNLRTGVLTFDLEGDPREALKKLYYDTSLDDDPESFLLAARVFGVDRLVLGTDSPRVTTGEIVGYLRGVPGVADGDLDGVLGDTARGLLAL